MTNFDDFIASEKLKSEDFKGGRGKKAPYETVMYRIPSPIKPVVEHIGYIYRQFVANAVNQNDQQLIKRIEDSLAGLGYELYLDEKSNLDTLIKMSSHQAEQELQALRERVQEIRIPKKWLAAIAAY